MSSVTTTTDILAGVDKQLKTGIARLRAQHDDAFKSEVERLQADLTAQAARMAQIASPSRSVAAATRVAAPAVQASAPKPTVKSARKARSMKGVIKYRDPLNPERTWTGRGTPPNWIKDAKDRTPFVVVQPGA